MPKYIALTPTLNAFPTRAGGLTLESVTPISGKAEPVKGLYRVTLTPAQATEWSAILADPKRSAAAVKAGKVALSTGQRGAKRRERVNVMAAIKAARTATPKGPKGPKVPTAPSA